MICKSLPQGTNKTAKIKKTDNTEYWQECEGTSAYIDGENKNNRV